MTNQEIIINDAIAQGLFSEEEVKLYLDKGLTLPLHTYKHWHELGFQVDKGQKAALITRLWKTKGHRGRYSLEADAMADGEEETGFFLAKSHLFMAYQVSRIEKTE